jgi:hypothetical protein
MTNESNNIFLCMLGKFLCKRKKWWPRQTYTVPSFLYIYNMWKCPWEIYIYRQAQGSPLRVDISAGDLL